MIKILKNPIVKTILSMLAVAVFGFILLNITFIFDAIYQGIIDWIIKLFTPVDINTTWYWFPPLKHTLFVIIIGIISWFVFKSKLKTIYKAIFMTVPLATVFLTIGMFLYRWPLAAYLLGSLFALGFLYYLYKKKAHWLYYFALILISLVMLLVGLLGVEI